TSLPSAFRRAARAVTASVGEGLTRWTRRERDTVTGCPVDRWNYRDASYIKGLRSGRPSPFVVITRRYRASPLRGRPDRPLSRIAHQRRSAHHRRRWGRLSRQRTGRTHGTYPFQAR